MEYGLYLALMLPIFMWCGFKIWQLGMDGRAQRSRRAVKDTAGNGSADLSANADPLPRQELRGIPTPWGWPGSTIAGSHHRHVNGHGTGAHASSGMLNRWVDRIVAEKQTTDDRKYLERRDASMRALLEDRFHSAGHLPLAQKSHGIKGNGSGQDQDAAATNGRTTVPLKPANDRSISGVRTPWGW